MVDAGGVTLIETGHHAQHSCRIFRRARDDAGLVETRCERDHAVARDAAVGRFDAHGAGQRRRLPNRATGIGAGRCRREACRNGRRRAAGRTAGRTIEVPWIPHRPVITRLIGRAHREFIHVGFAEHHGTCRRKSFDDGGIVRRDEVVEHLRAAGRAYTASAKNILVNNGQAVQHAGTIRPPCFVSACGSSQRFVGRHCYEGIELGIKARDTLEQRLGQLHGRELAGREARRQAGQGPGMQFRARNAHSMTFGTRYRPSATPAAFSWK